MGTFIVERPLRFGQCDPSGIAYFPSYLDTMVGVTEAFFAHLGFPWPQIINERKLGTPTVKLDLTFSKPSLFGDVLHYNLTPVKVGRTSLELEHVITCGEEVRWSARQVLVLTTHESQGSVPWPDDIRAALNRFMESQDAYRSAA